MTDEQDAYAVLGVERGADDATIVAAHRRLAWDHHPDVAGDAGTARMMVINAAFDAIRTAARRAAYDGLPDPSSTTGSAASGVAHRTPDGSDRFRRRPANDGTGKAGPPPGRPSGSVLDFGRHKGWSMGEIARVDPGYLIWLEDRPEGQPYLLEIDATLRRLGHRPASGSATAETTAGRTGPSRPRRSGFRRR
jgi:curved DNA-binding protein CbpA